MMSNGFYCMYCLWIAVLLQSAYIVAPEECEEPTTGEPLRYLAAGLRSLQNRHIEEAVSFSLFFSVGLVFIRP